MQEKKNLSERIEEIEAQQKEELRKLREKKEQIDARFAKKLARLKEQERKKRTQRMIILGAIVEAAAERDPLFARSLLNAMPSEWRSERERKAMEPVIKRLRERVEAA